jgi:hypothetical protein
MKEEKEMTTQGNLYYITMLVFSIPGPGPTSLVNLGRTRWGMHVSDSCSYCNFTITTLLASTRSMQ